MENFKEPEFLPVLTEMFSKALVIAGEQNLPCSNSSKSKRSLKFSNTLNAAYLAHKKACNAWRNAGRPISSSHPAKLENINTQRRLQQIRREEMRSKDDLLYNKLMESHSKDFNLMYNLLKKTQK